MGINSVSFPSTDVVSDCFCAVAHSLQWPCCFSLSVAIFTWILSRFSMPSLFFPSFWFFFCSVFFSLWVLRFICCLCLLALQNTTVYSLLGVLWKVVVWNKKFWEGKEKDRQSMRGREQIIWQLLVGLQENGDKPAHPGVTFPLCRLKIPVPNLHVLLLLN